MKYSFEKGQTIIEVLIALSTAVVIVSASTLVVLTAINNSTYTQAQNSATKYAQEGVEFMRFLRSSNYTTFSSYPEDTYCLDKDATTLYAANKTICGVPKQCGTNVGVFSRSVLVEKSSPAIDTCSPLAPSPLTPTPVNTAVKVTITVSWSDSKCENACPCHTSQLVSCISDYTRTSAPTP